MSITDDPSIVPAQKDWARQPLASCLWWCVPIALGVSSNFLKLPPRGVALVWAFAFIWMAAGCFLNAVRCHRLHCYISGPVLLLGAIASGVFASGALDLGPHALDVIVSSTFGLVLASFVPEFLWRKYA